MFIHTASQVSELTGGFLSHEHVKQRIDEEIDNLKSIYKNQDENNQEKNFKDLILEKFKDAVEDLNRTLSEKLI